MKVLENFVAADRTVVLGLTTKISRTEVLVPFGAAGWTRELIGSIKVDRTRLESFVSIRMAAVYSARKLELAFKP